MKNPENCIYWQTKSKKSIYCTVTEIDEQKLTKKSTKNPEKLHLLISEIEDIYISYFSS